jgi:hypothetical protein
MGPDNKRSFVFIGIHKINHLTYFRNVFKNKSHNDKMNGVRQSVINDNKVSGKLEVK